MFDVTHIFVFMCLCVYDCVCVCVFAFMEVYLNNFWRYPDVWISPFTPSSRQYKGCARIMTFKIIMN